MKDIEKEAAFAEEGRTEPTASTLSEEKKDDIGDKISIVHSASSHETHDSHDSDSHSYHSGHTSSRPQSLEGSPQNNLSRQTTSSECTPPPVNVPRSERRGLLASFCLIPEITEPYHHPRSRKWLITFIIAVAGAAAPTGSSIILPALTDVSNTLNSTPTVTNLSVAFYMLSMSIFPLWWSSFSETLGRRSIYVVSFAMLVVFAVLAAESQNIAMLIVMRVLVGGASASVQAVGAGTVADIWEVKERGRAMGIFYMGPLCGPLIAPIFGGILDENLGWRSTQYFLVVYGAITWIAILFFLPETLRRKEKKNIVAEAGTDVAAGDATNTTADSEVAGQEKNEGEKKVSSTSQPRRLSLQRVSTRQSVHKRTKKTFAVLRRCFLDPLSIILYIRIPAVALTVYYAAITFCTLYYLNISISYTFSKAPYGYSSLIVGLLYIPNSFGYILASILGGKWIDTIMKREAKRKGRVDAKGKLVFRPEDRMRENAWLGAFLFPAALIWYGWTAEKGVIWIVPMIANFIFGIGSMLIFAMATTMLTEFIPARGSAGIALNNFVRNIFSFIGVVTAEPAMNSIGNGWLFTILGLVSLFSGIGVISTMLKYGEPWREKRIQQEAERERKKTAGT